MAEFLGTPEVGDLAEFKKTIVASTDWEAFADLVVASERDAFLSADTPVESRPGPLTHGRLRAFVDALDLNERFGLKRTDNVCTAIPNGPEAAVLFVGVATQCVFAPLNPQLTAPEIEFELEDLPAHAMILMEARLPAQKGNALYESPKLVLECCDANSVPVITLIPDASVAGLFTLDSELSKTPGPAVPKATKDDLALVLHTSGTTKKPKIVPLTHGNIGHGVQFVARTLRRQPDDVCINIMPLFHIHGVIANIMVTLYSGSRVVCTRGFQGGDDFLDKLADDSLGPPTWYSAVPTMHEAILLAAEDRGSKGPWVHSLQMLRNCSAALLPPVSERFINAFGTKLKKEFTVVPTYAMTESFPICSNPPHLECKLSTVGPAMGPEIKILKGHPDDEEVAPGEEGEVCVFGGCVTAGYLIRPHMDCDPNVEALTKPGTVAAAPLLRTGDKGYIDEDGYLQLLGRFKEIINRGGEKISPLEIEERLLKCDGVETCVCFAVPCELLGEVVGVALVCTAEVKAAAEALEADDHKLSRFLRKGEEKDWADPRPQLSSLRGALKDLSPQWRPQCVVYMDAIPKGPTGKPKRIGLAKLLKMPLLSIEDQEHFQVAGVGEKHLEKLTYADGRYLFPPHISITLSMNDDLSDFWFQQHALHYEDERHALHKLVMTSHACGIPMDTDWWTVTPEDMRRTLKELMRRRKLYGKEWESPLELGDGLMKYDWHGDLVVRDLSLFDPDRPIRDQDAEVIIMHHKWRKNCRVPPPGLIMELLKMLN